MRRDIASSVNLDHHVFTPRTAVPRSTSQLVSTIQQQFNLRVILVFNAALLVAPKFPDQGEHPSPVAVASRKNVFGLLLGNAGLAVEGVLVHFDERVTRSWTTSTSVVVAGLAGDAALMGGLGFDLLE
jgi:hypothetical protein